MTPKNKKTKAQIEKEAGIVDPEDYSGKIFQWIIDRDAKNLENWRDMIREELEPVQHFMRLAMGNRIWLVILSGVVSVICFIILRHLILFS